MTAQEFTKKYMGKRVSVEIDSFGRVLCGVVGIIKGAFNHAPDTYVPVILDIHPHTQTLAHKDAVYLLDDTATSSTITTDFSRYPQTCPKCKAPAYLGLNEVNCSAGCK